MKKLLLILLLFSGFCALAQVTPSGRTENFNFNYYYFKNYVEIGKGVIFPNRDTNWTPKGPSITYYADAWYGYSPAVGYWKALLEAPAAPNALLSGGNIIQIGDTTFFISAARYRIDQVVYVSDSAILTVRLSDSLNRIDKFYLATDGLAHVKEGEVSATPVEPQLDGDQLGLAFVTITEGETSVSITSTIVYDENTGESTVTNTGTTTDPNNTTNVFTGTKSLNVTNINDPIGTSGDVVNFLKPIGTWNLTGISGFVFSIKLKAVMNTNANLRVQFYVGNTPVSTEVLIGLDKNNITSFQPIAFSLASYNPIQNYNITRVRIRYTRPGNTSNYTGFYLDDMKFIEGLIPGSPAGSVSSVGISIGGDAYAESNTPVVGTGVLTLTPQGNATHYINGFGNLITFPDILTDVGTLDGRAKNADGGTIDGTEFFFQTADSVYPGLFTPDMYDVLYVHDSIQNTGPPGVDTLLWPIDGHTIGVKGIKDSLDLHIIDHGEYWTMYVDASGASGALFGVTGDDDVAAENRSFDYSGYDFNINGTGSGSLNLQSGGSIDEVVYLNLGTQQATLSSENYGIVATLSVHGGAGITLDHDLGYYTIANLDEVIGGVTKMLVVDSTNGRIYEAPIPTGGGGYTDEQAQDATGAMINASLQYVDGTPLLAIGDRDYGDITFSGSGLTAAIDNNAVTNAKINDVDWSKVTGEPTTLSGYGITDAQPVDGDLTAIAALSPSNDDIIQRKAGAWTNRTMAQLKTDLDLSGTNTGDQTTITGNAGTATALQTGRTIAITGDITYTSPSFDGSGNVTAAGTLATVNGDVGSFTNANITVNAKGLITAASSGTAGLTFQQVLGISFMKF